MNINDVIDNLRGQPEMPLVFELEGNRIKEGYHITEVKRADVVSLDCGLNQQQWTELTVQLLDGRSGSSEPWMMNHKASAILKAAMDKLQVPDDTPTLYIEYSPGNSELKKLSVQDIKQYREFSVVTLQHKNAVCKPYQNFLASSADTNKSACCQGGAVDTQCC